MTWKSEKKGKYYYQNPSMNLTNQMPIKYYNQPTFIQ